MSYRIPFGSLRIGPTAKRNVERALLENWVSEGQNVREFEEQFSRKFGWKHAIMTSSGSTAATVLWSAIRELTTAGWMKRSAITPACAFVSTANSLLAAGIWPEFVDIELETLNLDLSLAMPEIPHGRNGDPLGIQYVAQMGSPVGIDRAREITETYGLYLVGDWCEAIGARMNGEYAEHQCDAVINSFYAGHLLGAGEAGVIATDDDEIAHLCRSIKCHGYGKDRRFDFVRIGYNAKTTDLAAAIALEGIENFDSTFNERRKRRQTLIELLRPLEEKLILYEDHPNELSSPHAFPILIRDPDIDAMLLYDYLQNAGIECKSLFASLPTDHKAFAFLDYERGDFPIAERVGKSGLHFGIIQSLNVDDLQYIATTIKEFFR